MTTRIQFLEKKLAMANKMAEEIQERYGFRYEKCFSLAIQASWMKRVNDEESLAALNPEELKEEIFKEIDTNIIY